MSTVRLGRQGMSVPSNRLSDALAHTSSGLFLIKTKERKTMIELGTYNKRHTNDLELIRYAVEDQSFELDSGYIIVNRYPDGTKIRHSLHNPKRLHLKSKVYFYDKDDLYQPIKHRWYAQVKHLEPLIPIVVGHQKRVVIMRVPPNTNQQEFNIARKKQLDLSRRISPYWT